MDDNPFVKLRDEFSTAVAKHDTRDFAVMFWRSFPRKFIDDPKMRKKIRNLGYCQLPCRPDGKLGKFVLGVPAMDLSRDLWGSHNCASAFEDLASRAGASLALVGEIRGKLEVYFPACRVKSAPWWIVLLWKLTWDRPFPGVLGEAGEPTRKVLPTFGIACPFQVSVRAIEVCRLDTDSPCLPKTPDPECAKLAGVDRWQQETDGNVTSTVAGHGADEEAGDNTLAQGVRTAAGHGTGKRPPSTIPPDAFLSPAQLAESHGVSYDALRKRLERWRANNKSGEGWLEIADRKPKQPQYLYKTEAIQGIIDELKRATSRTTSEKKLTRFCAVFPVVSCLSSDQRMTFR